MKHMLLIGILVAISTISIHTGLDSIGLLPPQASAQAIAIDELFEWHVWMISFLFSLIVVTLVYSLIAFRRRRGETGDGAHIEGHAGLEVLWTMAPLFVVVYLAFIGAQSLGETRRVDPSALEVDVIAGQWFWRFEYPGQGVVSTELVLPVDRQVYLRMESLDVIHSFWVPEFRVKQDIVPGQVTELRITPIMTGSYKVLCAELCGTSHAYMEAVVIVLDESDFADWLAGQSASVEDDPVARGRRLSEQNGCLACHSVDGSQKVGPTWTGLFGSQVRLADDSVALADENFIISSILDPDMQVVEGYTAGVMPSNYRDLFEESQLDDIVAYIISLGK
ncbi:MAG: cytochrome c oxidase subunit II [Chloroflexi bacterium]|nr:cytochrome c oxidase subunit II [Chloroflexota bacterium]